MKKIFTLAAAILASFSLAWAETKTYSFADATELNNFTYTAGDTGDEWGVYTTTKNSVAPRDGGFAQYKCAKSSKTATFVTKESLEKISNISFYIASSDKGKTQVKIEISPKADFSANVTEVVNATGGLSGLGISSPSNNTWYSVSLNVSEISGYVRFSMTAGSSGKYWSYDDIVISYTAAPATAPVTEVTLEGSTSAYIGFPAVYTATTDVKATAYKWFVNDVEQGSDSAKFIFNAESKGTYNIVCKARNDNNATDAWVASSAKVVNASVLYGEMIKATLNGGTSATMTGALEGTFDSNLGSGKYKLDKGVYAGVQLASGSFQEGDTVVITMTAAGSNYPCLFADKNKAKLLYLATETSSDLVYKIVLPSAANGESAVYLVRDNDDATYKWNPTVSAISVVRPMAIKSTVVSLSAVTINDVAISESDLNKLVSGSSHTLILENSYLNAPVVKFTKHTVITYDDDSQKESDEVIEVTSQQSSASTWGASATIGETTYFVNTVKTMSYVVTYMFGTEELGTENVAQNGNPANYATYQTIDNNGLSTFVGWYNNADLAEGHAVANMAAEVITANTTYYAKFTIKYASSINIEQWVLDNAVDSAHTVALLALLGTNNYASNISYKKGTNELDSLSDKTDRNEPYLGLKVKESGKLINFRLAPESIVKVKFGETKTTPKVAINGGEYTDMTLTEKVYTYTATGEDLVSIYISEANKAVVFKQIMIGEDIQDVTLPDVPTALDNTEATVKATKRIVNGQLLIEKNGVLYNAQGAVVR